MSETPTTREDSAKSEAKDEEADVDGGAGLGCRGCLLKGCLPLVALAGLIWLLVMLVMAETRRTMAADLRKRIDAAASASPIRPVLFGEPVEGDAEPVYRTLEWCINPKSMTAAPAEFQKSPTVRKLGNGQVSGLLGNDIYLLGARTLAVVTPPDSVRMAAGFMKAPKPSKRKTRPKGTAKTPAKGSAKAKAPHGALTRKAVLGLGQALELCDLLRLAVRRKECRWIDGSNPAGMMNSQGLLNYRSMANLMAERALRSSPAEALDDGLATVAFGRDIGGAPSLMMSMIGIACEAIGYRIIEEALGRQQSKARLETLLAELDRIQPIDPGPVIESERMVFGTVMTALAGEPLPGRSRESVIEELAPNGPTFIYRSETLMTREWAIVDRELREITAAAKLPPGAAATRIHELEEERRSSWSLMVHIAMPNYVELLKQFREIEASRQMLRITVAARLHQLETGSFPKTPAPLAKHLGGAVPLDPVDGKTPFKIATTGPWFGVKSTFRNGHKVWTCIPGTPRTTFKDLDYPLTAQTGKSAKDKPEKAKVDAK